MAIAMASKWKVLRPVSSCSGVEGMCEQWCLVLCAARCQASLLSTAKTRPNLGLRKWHDSLAGF